MAACLLSLSLYRRGVVLFAVLLLLLADFAHAQSEQGNYCVHDYMPGAVCTANDVRIVEFQVVETLEACGTVTPGQAKVRLRAFVSSAGAPDRYDIGLFMATDGGSALSGDSCLHDFLSGGVSATPPYGDFNNDGVDDLRGPPWQDNGEDDADTCGDIRADSQVFKNEDVVMIPCRDADDDGVVDVSACATWDNNKSNGAANSPHCSTVSNSYPGTSSKCGCDEVVAVTGLPAGAIELTKLPATQTVEHGTSAHFTLTATNPTAVDLTNVVLDDPRCTTLSRPSGDANGNSVLESTETWTWSCVTTNVQQSFTNVGTVTALAHGQTVTDRATADVFVGQVAPPAGTSAIEIEKLLRSTTLDAQTGVWTIVIAFEVTNTGDFDLSNVVVTDALSASAGGNFGTWTPTMPTRPGTYTVSSVTAQGLEPNAAFTGDAGNTTVATGALGPGARGTAELTIWMMPQREGALVNQSRVTAVAPDGPVEDDDTLGMTIGQGTTGPAPIPVDAPWALLLLALGAVLLGMRRIGMMH